MIRCVNMGYEAHGRLLPAESVGNFSFSKGIFLPNETNAELHMLVLFTMARGSALVMAQNPLIPRASART